jgi:hypothetical protein
VATRSRITRSIRGTCRRTASTTCIAGLCSTGERSSPCWLRPATTGRPLTPSRSRSWGCYRRRSLCRCAPSELPWRSPETLPPPRTHSTRGRCGGYSGETGDFRLGLPYRPRLGAVVPWLVDVLGEVGGSPCPSIERAEGTSEKCMCRSVLPHDGRPAGKIRACTRGRCSCIPPPSPLRRARARPRRPRWRRASAPVAADGGKTKLTLSSDRCDIAQLLGTCAIFACYSVH